MCNPKLELWPGVALLEAQTELGCAQEVLVMQDGMCVGSKGGELSDLLSLCRRCPQRYVLPALPSAGVWLQGILVAVAQSFSPVQLFAALWTAAHQAPLAFTISQSVLNLMPVEAVMHPAISCSCRPNFSHLP